MAVVEAAAVESVCAAVDGSLEASVLATALSTTKSAKSLAF